jgi:NitT/TauT family transport system ATP-binding protein
MPKAMRASTASADLPRRRPAGDPVLRDICFEVAAGNSSRSSKAAAANHAARILHGLEPPTSGTVFAAGSPVTAPSTSSAMVFQHFNLFQWLTVLQNVAFSLEVRGLPKAECAERANRFVSLVGLEGFAGHYPHEISGGMQQRVGLARAFALDPDILMMDEPFGSLDAITREQLQREIAGILAQSPRTAVFITHNMDEAIFFSDRILVMSPRPSRLVEEVSVDLPRPREAGAVRASRQFASVREHLWSLLSHGASVP